MAGVNTRKLAQAAALCPYWLLSVGLLPRGGPQLWLEPHLSRPILWDPGTFSDTAPTFARYRDWLSRFTRPHHAYLAYDEIGGDPELNLAYLHDMRRRGLSPIPIYHRGMPTELLQEPALAVGGLVPLTDRGRAEYLDWLFYDRSKPCPSGQVHLLGVGQRRWFARCPATSGDSTTWIPRFPYNRERSIDEWVADYGEQEIPLNPPMAIQGRFEL